jgi:hypothetical protein
MQVSVATQLVALLVASLACLARVSAHDIPRDVTVQAFAKPEGQRFRLLLRVPLKALTDVEFPRREGDYVDLARVDRSLRDAANIWLANRLDLYEDDARLADPRIGSTRMSLESDRSFGSYDQALMHVLGPPLPNDTAILWEQGFLDALFEYRIRSDRSSFSIHAAFHRLGLRVVTALRFMPPGGMVRAYELEGDAGLIRLDPSRLQAASLFARLGVFHILYGTDYLLFLFCLVMARRSLRSLVPIVTSFIVAHSITLMASSYGYAPLAPWFPLLINESIALSILYVALENLLLCFVGADGAASRPALLRIAGRDVRAETMRRSIIAFLFGLVHGVGFSFGLQHTKQFAGSHQLTSLLSFNIGVEAGLLLVLALMVSALAALFRFFVAERMGAILLSAIVAHTAWHWTADRFDLLRQVPWPGLAADAISVVRWVMAIAALASLAWLAFVWTGRAGRQSAAVTRGSAPLLERKG